MQLCERLSGRLHYLFLRVLCKIKYLNILFELNEGASLNVKQNFVTLPIVLSVF